MGLVYFSFHNTGYRAVLSVEEQGIAIKPGKLYLQLNVQYTIFFYSSYWSTLNIHINWHFSSLILYYQFLFDILFNFLTCWSIMATRLPWLILEHTLFQNLFERLYVPAAKKLLWWNQLALVM